MSLLIKMIESSRLEFVNIIGAKIDRKNSIVTPIMRKALMYGVEKLEYVSGYHLNDENVIKLCELTIIK